MLFKRLKSNQGAALITTIMVMVVLMILGIALLDVALADTKHAVLQEKNTQAHYIARSGAEVGLKKLKDLLTTNTYTDMDSLIADLPGPSLVTINSSHSYNLSYSRKDSREVKILSEGIVQGNVNDYVSITVKTTFPGSLSGFAEEWFSGINLKKDIDPDVTSYLGAGVFLEGNPTQSPMGSSGSSTFRASVINFTDYKGVSLRQIQNSIPITFDAEVICVQSDIKLNKSGDNVSLSLSDIVAADKATNSSSPLYATSGSSSNGFEDVDRYKAFIASCSPPVNINGVTYVDKTTWNPLTLVYDHGYTFVAGTKYGLIYFSGDVLDGDGNVVISSGYYFYPSGESLRSGTGLIAIDSDDAVIPALDNLFKLTVSSAEGYLWDNK